MGQLSCNRCGAKADGASQAEANEKIDHARGQMIGRPCDGKDSDCVWNGASKPKQVVENVVELTPEPEHTDNSESSPKKKSKKSNRR